MAEVTTTYLEMTSPDQLRPRVSHDERFRIDEATVDQWQVNRFLYEFVGGQWEWEDKLSWRNEQWQAYVEDESLHTFIANYDGSIAGYFELALRNADVQIAYFGLAPQFIGRGLGGPLLTRAIREAWKLEPKRVWVHTCTLDHEAALGNYLARGMTVYKTETNEIDNE